MNPRTLVFPDEQALLAALTSRLIPIAVQRRKVTYWTDAASGAIYVRPVRKLSRDVIALAQAAGVGIAQVSDPPDARHGRIWPQMIVPRPTRDDVEVAGQTVLIYIPSSSSRTLIDLTAELLRLGCDRCAYQLLATTGGDDAEPIALLRVFDPPYYTIAAAGERDATYRAFTAVRTGDTRTWIEASHAHPLAHVYVPPQEHIGLIFGDGEWLDLPDGPWHDMFDIVDIQLPAGRRTFVPIPPPRRLEVRLRLTSATRTEAPGMWVLRAHDDESPDPGERGGAGGAIDAVDSLVSTLPDDIIARLLFSVVGERDAPVVVLRARHGRAGPPNIDVPGVAMTPLFGLNGMEESEI